MFQKSFIQLGDSDLSFVADGEPRVRSLLAACHRWKRSLRYEYDKSNRPVVNMSLTPMRPWGAPLRGLSVAQRSEDKRSADNKRDSFSDCHFRTAAKRNENDGFKDSRFSTVSVSQSRFSARRRLQIGRPPLWTQRARVWIINHDGTINTLFSQVLLSLKMSKADGELPVAKLWFREKKRKERMKRK